MALLSAYIDLMPLSPYHDSWLQLHCGRSCSAHPHSKSLFTLHQLFLPNFSPLLLPPDVTVKAWTFLPSPSRRHTG